ncbi:MAG: family 43 glycosylhydrolase [Clostridia bacterium]|nr:family 43 glycosylhydrolase [Clostridia bacterium]
MFDKLLAAILKDDLAAVQALLPMQPALIEQEHNGEPLSHIAAREGSLRMLRYLVEYGLRVNLNALDSRGRDLLHYAAESGDADKCRYLVERGGMNPLRGDRQLTTPYHLAHSCGHSAVEAYFEEATGAPLVDFYQNPIRRGMFPDPSIVRVGEDYYMVNSTFVFFPCIPVSHSRDLVNWQVIGHAIANPEWAHLEGLDGGRGWWAPDISYANGRFYITATLRLNDGGLPLRRQMIVHSDRPEGPYSEPVFIEEEGIDPSLFHDDDGRHYMLINRGARILELDETCTKRVSETTLLYYGSNKRAPEGPHLLKKDGWYYLFLAEGGTGMNHRETVARSRSLMGPYQPSPYGDLLRQHDEHALIQRCGHAKPFSTPDGRWYLVYLCGRALDGKWTMMGRETALDPIVWTADGWPLLVGGPSTLGRRPLPEHPLPDTIDWLTPRPPRPGMIEWQGKTVTIRGGSEPMTDTACRSLAVRRQTDFQCGFTAVLERCDAQEAGLTCYYDEHSFLNLCLQDGELVVYAQIGLEGREFVRVPFDGGMPLRLNVQTDGLMRRLYAQDRPVCELDQVTWLSDEGVTVGKRFTGAMLGVYAIGGEAVFTIP